MPLGCLRPEEVFPGFPLGMPPTGGVPPPRPVPLGPELTPQKRVHRAAVRVWRHTAPRHDGHAFVRSEEHTSELQSRGHLVCRLLLEKKKNKQRRMLLNNQPRNHSNSLSELVIHAPNIPGLSPPDDPPRPAESTCACVIYP